MSFSQKDNIINNINPDFEPINYEDEKMKIQYWKY